MDHEGHEEVLATTPRTDPAASLDRLPAGVRRQVLALAAAVLPDVPDLPGTLRSVATFAPARRVRRGGTAIADALADPELRARVGTLAAPTVAADAPDADRAALLWLSGEDPETLAVLVERVGATRSADPGAGEEADRLRGRLEAARDEERSLRARHRDEVAELKEQHKVLRTRLGQARAAERDALSRVAGLEQDLAAAREAARAPAAAEAEVRRLRAQVAELGAQVERLRSAGRAEREDGAVRARLLLESVIDAAAGLRRELSLPAVEGSPAARVEEELEARSGARGPSQSGALGVDSPALLSQLLSLPRARLVVDGYNVSKAAWPDSSLEAQRARLLTGLAPLAGRTGAETTVVFDAHAVDHRPVVPTPRGVRVLFSARGVLADDVIRDLVAAEPAGRAVVVVTSDRAVADDVRRAGFRVAGAPALIGLLAR